MLSGNKGAENMMNIKPDDKGCEGEICQISPKFRPLKRY